MLHMPTPMLLAPAGGSFSALATRSGSYATPGGWLEDANFGGGTYDDGVEYQDYTGFLVFPVAVPPGATIVSANLVLSLLNTSSTTLTGLTLDLSRVPNGTPESGAWSNIFSSPRPAAPRSLGAHTLDWKAPLQTLVDGGGAAPWTAGATILFTMAPRGFMDFVTYTGRLGIPPESRPRLDVIWEA